MPLAGAVPRGVARFLILSHAQTTVLMSLGYAHHTSRLPSVNEGFQFRCPSLKRASFFTFVPMPVVHQPRDAVAIGRRMVQDLANHNAINARALPSLKRLSVANRAA